MVGVPFETSPCRGLLLPPRLPPATGYFSFETPLAIGRSELTRSELETSRVWSLLGASWQPARCGAYSERLHYITFTLSVSHTLNLTRRTRWRFFGRRALRDFPLPRVTSPSETSPCHGLLLLRDSSCHWQERAYSERAGNQQGVELTWSELAASKVRSLLGAVALHNLHTVGFSHSESNTSDQVEVLW